MKVMIVVTHLLGSGHLSRALTLGRAFKDSGHGVTLVSGGQRLTHLDSAGLHLVQLPSLRSDGTNFTRLLNDQDEPASDDDLQQRKSVLMDTVQNEHPDVLITELFPFGRRILSDEFTALLSAAKALPKPPVILASIRDILAPPSSEKKANRTAQIIDDHYDGVLVHSVEKLVPLSASWPVNTDLAAKLHYTGFVAPPLAAMQDTKIGQGEILVSAGGGAVGDHLFEAAIKAANQDTSRHWRILVGGADPSQRIETLKSQVTRDTITIEPARPDFRDLLRNAACSISMCGYNTALDILQTATPAIFVPFDDGGEVEQGLRADSLSQHTGISVIRSNDLTGDTILQALKTVTRQRRRPMAQDQFDGARTTVQIACKLAAKR